MKYIIEIPDDVLSEVKKITTARIETICGMPMKQLIECKDCSFCKPNYMMYTNYGDKKLAKQFCLKWGNEIKGDGYCHLAKRKEE